MNSLLTCYKRKPRGFSHQPPCDNQCLIQMSGSMSASGVRNTKIALACFRVFHQLFDRFLEALAVIAIGDLRLKSSCIPRGKPSMLRESITHGEDGYE